MNKEDKIKIHELIKSDDQSNKLLGFTIGRQIGLSDLELLELTKDGGFLIGYNGYIKMLYIGDVNLDVYINTVALFYHKKMVTLVKSNDEMLPVFTQFLNLIL